MVDRQRVRELYAYVRACEADGVPSDLLAEEHRSLAGLYEGLALDGLDCAGVGSWPELFAAITEYAHAGELEEARRLVELGKQHGPPHATAMHRELDHLVSWMAGLSIAAEYRLAFAERNVLGKLGSDAERRQADERVRALLDRLSDEHREGVARWEEQQAAAAPVQVPVRVGVEASDPHAKPIERAA